jgi:hypothetical protein
MLIRLVAKREKRREAKDAEVSQRIFGQCIPFRPFSASFAPPRLFPVAHFGSQPDKPAHRNAGGPGKLLKFIGLAQSGRGRPHSKTLAREQCGHSSFCLAQPRFRMFWLASTFGTLRALFERCGGSRQSSEQNVII